MSCETFEAKFSAYVDGECPADQRAAVEAHLQACHRCRSRVASERTTHELLRARCRDLRGCAPAALRQRCAAQRALAAPAPGRLVRRRWVSLSLAASAALAVTVFALFGWGSSVETYAAQLALDHIKCFQFPPEAAQPDVDLLGREWLAANGWPLKVAAASAPEKLELIGLRRCGSTRGRVAHILYRWRGEPLSVFVLNARADEADGRSELAAHDHDAVRKLGEQEIIWSERGRTYAVVARARIDDLQRVAAYVRHRIE
jgi:anti-sigma factor RsiW